MRFLLNSPLASSIVLHPAATGTASAAKVGMGAVELVADGSFRYDSLYFEADNLESASTAELRAGANYSVSDRLAVGGSVAFVHESLDPVGSDIISSSALGLGANVLFNFAPHGSTIPYYLGIGAGILNWSGNINEDADTTLIIPSAFAGIRIRAGASASFNVGVEYSHRLNAGGIKDVNSSSFGVRFGFSVFPRGFAPHG